jgi:hypothetical protein
MGRARAQREWVVQLQPLSDRLASQKMAQAYGLLVPVPIKSCVSKITQPQLEHEQTGGDLRTGILGAAEGG